MTGTTTEIMMQFIGDDGQAIPAECTTYVGPNDKLAAQDVPDFAKGFQPGCYFLVDTFKFGMTLNDGETKTSKNPNDALLGSLKNSNDPAVHKMLKHLASAAAGNRNAAFARWRSAEKWKQQDNQTPPYNAHVDEFSFTRRVDTASTTLFSYCCTQKSFKFASLIKRKSATVPDDPFPENQTYLRIDFADVQISNFQWSDDDVIEETCGFRAKKMLIQFWTEGVDQVTKMPGILNPFNAVSWENKVANTPAK